VKLCVPFLIKCQLTSKALPHCNVCHALPWQILYLTYMNDSSVNSFKNEILNLKCNNYRQGYIPTTFSRYAISDTMTAIPANTNPIGPNM